MQIVSAFNPLAMFAVVQNLVADEEGTNQKLMPFRGRGNIPLITLPSMALNWIAMNSET